jgi:RimJ/RimL family protein N-acetyltransferase
LALDVRLRDVQAGDLPVLYRQQLDPEASQMASFPPRERDAFDAHWAKVLADPALTKKTILVGEEIAGHVVIFEMSGELEVGYWIGREHWGKGVATRALQLLLQSSTARPLRAHVARHNVASIRVLEKCGFTVVGEGKGSVRGEEVDELILALE